MTTATTFGLAHPDSSANFVRRAKQEEAKSKAYRKKIREVEARLFPKTEEQV
jgi:ketopantoate hydroxymethyltransferase